MSLKNYLKRLVDEGGTDALEDFAQRCETSVGQLKQVAGGYRRAGETLAINIERESGGEIRCEMLRPDVDWQYLRSTKPDEGRSNAA